MAKKRDIVADSFLMLELALMIGRNAGLDARQQCRNLFKVLLPRHRISYASVWILAESSPYAKPLFAMPAIMEQNDRLTERDQQLFADVQADWDDQDAPDGFLPGRMLVVKLNDLGLVKLFFRDVDTVDPVSVNQLLPILEILAVSLNGYFDKQRLAESEAQAHADQEEAERLRKVAERALAEAQHANQVKNNFLLSVSHELRTPLNAIIGFSQIIEQMGVDTLGIDRVQEYLSDIHNSGDHLLGLVDDILDISRIEHESFELDIVQTDIGDIAAECVRTMQPRATEKKMMIRFSTDDTALVRLDVRRFRQCVLNLVSNAIKYAPAHTVVRVEVGRTERGFAVRVVDEGDGIPQKVLDRIGEPFNRHINAATAHVGGTGLGLAITKQLMERLGGRLQITSMQGAGTKASLILPLARLADSPQAEAVSVAD